MSCVPLVRLLLPHIAGPDLRRVPHPQLVTQVRQQIHQPVTVPGRFHPDQRRRRYLPVKPLRIARGLHQLLLAGLARLRIQPTHLLPAGMKITSYNHHLMLLSVPSVFGPSTERLTRGSAWSLRSYPISPSFAWAGLLSSVAGGRPTFGGREIFT